MTPNEKKLVQALETIIANMESGDFICTCRETGDAANLDGVKELIAQVKATPAPRKSQAQFDAEMLAWK